MVAEHALVRTAVTRDGEAFNVVLKVLLFGECLAALLAINVRGLLLLLLFVMCTFFLGRKLTITHVVTARQAVGRFERQHFTVITHVTHTTFLMA